MTSIPPRVEVEQIIRGLVMTWAVLLPDGQPARCWPSAAELAECGRLGNLDWKGSNGKVVFAREHDARAFARWGNSLVPDQLSRSCYPCRRAGGAHWHITSGGRAAKS